MRLNLLLDFLNQVDIPYKFSDVDSEKKKYILSSMGIHQILESEKRFIKSKYQPLEYIFNFFVFPIVAPSTPELVSQSYLYTGKSEENARRWIGWREGKRPNTGRCLRR